MQTISDPQEKAKKCKEEVYAVLGKYNCGMVATPVITTTEDGTVKFKSEVKIVPLFQPKKTEGEYLN